MGLKIFAASMLLLGPPKTEEKNNDRGNPKPFQRLRHYSVPHTPDR